MIEIIRTPRLGATNAEGGKLPDHIVIDCMMYVGCCSLAQVIDEIEKRIKTSVMFNTPEIREIIGDEPLINFELTSLSITSGIPHNDYGQTVRFTIDTDRKSPKAHKGKLTISA